MSPVSHTQRERENSPFVLVFRFKSTSAAYIAFLKFFLSLFWTLKLKEKTMGKTNVDVTIGKSIKT